MLKINQVTKDSKQRQNLTLPDGSTLVFVLLYIPQQYAWFITELTYKDFSVNNIKVTNNYNILHQFKNQIGIGLACISKQDREPMLLEDFSSGNSTLYILTADEVVQYTEFLQGV